MDTVERYYVSTPDDSTTKKQWGEVPRGLYIIRGENVAYLGEIDLDIEDEVMEGWEKVEAEEIHRLDRRVREGQKEEFEGRQRRLKGKGLSGEEVGEHIFG